MSSNAKELDSETRDAHFKYLTLLSTNSKMYAGGFEKIPGGIFTANDFNDARVVPRSELADPKFFLYLSRSIGYSLYSK